VHNYPVTGEPTLISARNHRQLYLGEGYDGLYGTEVAARKNHGALRHGLDGTGWTDVYERSGGRTTLRCFLGGDPRLTFEDVGTFFNDLR